MRLTKRGKKRLLLLGLGLVLLVGAGAGLYVFREIRGAALAKQRLKEGLAAHEAGDYETALHALGYYAQRNPEDLDTLLLYAEARSKVMREDGRHLADAAGLYDRILDAEPDNVEALEALLVLYPRLGRRVEMIDTAEALLEVDPNHVDAHRALISGHMGAGRYEDAKRYSERLVEIEPDSYRWRALHLGVLDESGTSPEDLVALVEGWLEAAPEPTGELLLLHAVTLASADRNEEAREALTKAAEKPAQEETLSTLLQVLDSFGMTEEADALIARTIEASPKQSWVHESAVRRRWQAGRLDLAREQLYLAREHLDSFSIPLLRFEALVQGLEGEEAAALETIDRLEALAAEAAGDERDAARAWVLALRARLDVENSSWTAALEKYDEALALVEEPDPILLYLRGEAYAAVGEHDIAAEAYRRAYDADRRWIAAGTAYVGSLRRLDRNAEALEAAIDLLTRTSPTVSEPYALALQSWLDLERSGLPVPTAASVFVGGGSSLDFAESLYQSMSESPRASILLVDAAAVHDRDARAHAVIDRMLGSEEATADDLLALAEISLREDLDRTEELIDAAEARGGAPLRTAAMRAELHRRAGEPEKGLAVFDALPEPEDADASLDRALARVRYLERADLPGVPEAVSALLDRESLPADSLHSILSLDGTWEDELLAQRAIDRLEEVVGRGSTRWKLAEATRILRFHAEDEEARGTAIDLCEDVLARAPDSLAALTLEANLLLTGETPYVPGAIEYLQRAIDHHPDQVHLYPRLISLLQNNGDFATAARYLEQLGRHRSLSPDLRRAELALLEAQGSFDEAITHLRGMVDETSPEMDQLALAGLSLRAGREDEVRSILDRLLERENPSPITLQFASAFYASRGEFDRGLALLRDAPLESEENRPLLLGAYHQQFGDPAEAGRLLRRAVEEDPSNAAAWTMLARHHLIAGRPEEAREAASAGLEVEPENQDLKTILASSSLIADEGDRDALLRSLQESEEENPALVETLEVFGQVTGDDGQFEPNDANLERVARLTREHPTFLPAWRLAVMLNGASDNPNAAVAVAHEAVTRNPTAAEPARWLTELLLSRRQYEQALAAAHQWRDRSLADPLAADVEIARLNLTLGRPSEALAALRPHATRLHARPDRLPEARSLYAQAQLLTGDVDGAWTTFGDAVAPESEALEVWLRTVRLAPPDVARRALERLEGLGSNHAPTRLNLALAWLDLAERRDDDALFDRARRTAEEVLTDPQHGLQARQALAQIAERRGDFEEAADQYAEVLREDPNNLIAMNNLAFVLGEKLRRPDEAAPWSSKAVEMRPDVAALHDTHALVLLGQTRLDEAERHAREAIDLAPEDPSYRLTLARVLLARQATADARREIQLADRLISEMPYPDPRLRTRLEEVRNLADAGS